MPVQEVTTTNQPQTAQPLTPAAIMQVGTGFWASKTLLAAIKLGLFTTLGDQRLSAEEIRTALHLHPRSLYDFLDALVALGFLQREGLYADALYSNTPETGTFLDKAKPTYMGAILELCNDRLYQFWGTLEEGLQTGEPQNEVKHSGRNQFEVFYEDPARLMQFMEGMAGIQMGAFGAFARTFDFSRYHTLCDVGGATGALSIQVALNNRHMTCTTFDLPAVEHVARAWVERFDMAGRVRVQNGDFFRDELPRADVITMGNILHDWGHDDKLRLAEAAYRALPEGGAFVVIESLIDDERRHNAFGLLMSLNMLIETHEGYDFTFADFRELCRKAGFTRFELLPLAGPTSAAVAYK